MSVVNDLGFASYLIAIKGKKLVKDPYFDGSKYIFEFDVPQKDLDLMFVEYLSTDFQRFDRILKQLKRVIYRKGSNNKSVAS